MYIIETTDRWIILYSVTWHHRLVHILDVSIVPTAKNSIYMQTFGLLLHIDILFELIAMYIWFSVANV